ncbi:MAG: HAD family hydrolase [Leptospiraceae bacterium]|nr:HAD family hydrolase [Leptospiraceae bacterium]
MLPLDLSSIHVLAFDIDGTLFSSEKIILSTYQKAISDYSIQSGKKFLIPSHAQIMKQIGKPVREIFKNLLPELSLEEQDSISNLVLKILCEKIEQGEGDYYEGASEVLHFLKQKGFQLVSASNGRKPYIEAILKQLQVNDIFDSILTLDYQTTFTKGDLLEKYLELFQITPQEILMIGDRDSDLQAAKQIHCPFLYCNYGHAEDDEVLEFSAEISSLRELPFKLGLLVS